MPSWRLKHPSTLADGWALNGTADSFFGRYPGTLVNTPTWGTFLNGRGCIEFDGLTQHVNIGDVLELNAVSAFSICFWMNQDVLDVTNFILQKFIGATTNIAVQTHATGGILYCTVYLSPGIYRQFTLDYSTVVSANNWHHVAFSVDLLRAPTTQAILGYIDGRPVGTCGVGGVMTQTPDLTGIDAVIGRVAAGLDGKLYDFRIASCAYSRDEIISIMHEATPVLA